MPGSFGGGAAMEFRIVKRLKEELRQLYGELHHQLPRELEEARAHGDLSENAEYEAARSRQEFLSARIAHIETRLRQLSLYNLSNVPQGVVAYGSRVTVEDVDLGDAVQYEIVFPEEVDVEAGRISLHSPLGQALLNKAEGDEVEVITPRGRRRYGIVRLITLHDLDAGGAGQRPE